MTEKVDFYGCDYDKLASPPSPEQSLRLIEEAFEIMRPKASPAPLIRVGGQTDGAYLLPDDLDGVYACFSPGVNNFKAFEDELATVHGIRSHMCDFSSDEHSLSTPLIPGVQTFTKAWLDVVPGPDAISLADWVAELGGDHGDDLVLQIDIEGAEYRNLLACPQHVLSRFRIIAIELHSLEMLLSPVLLEQVLIKFLRKLGADFVCVHAHPNNCCGEVVLPGSGANMPRLIELTFLRRDRFAKTAEALHPPLLPHPLDIDRNVEAIAPIILNKAWTGGARDSLSEIKALQEELSYQEYLCKRLAEEKDQLQHVLDLVSGVGPDAGSALQPSQAPSRHEQVEVAVGCTYTLSSSYEPGGEVGRIPSDGGRFFFHTEMGRNPWIRIDLGRPRLVRAVEISNRKDMCFDRAQSLYVLLNRDDENATVAAYPIKPPSGFWNGTVTSVETQVSPTRARYISIQSMADTALHLSAVKVYADAD